MGLPLPALCCGEFAEDVFICADCKRCRLYPFIAPNPPAMAVPATVHQLPWAAKLWSVLAFEAATRAAVPYTVAEPINAAAATVVAALVAAMPLATRPTDVAANAKLHPHVATVSIPKPATIAAPIAQ